MYLLFDLHWFSEQNYYLEMLIYKKLVRKINANQKCFTENKLVVKPSANPKHFSGELSMILQTVLKFLRHDNVTSCSKNILALHWFSNWFIFWNNFRFALIFRTNVFFRKKRKSKTQFPLKINANGIKIKIKTFSIENQWKH